MLVPSLNTQHLDAEQTMTTNLISTAQERFQDALTAALTAAYPDESVLDAQDAQDALILEEFIASLSSLSRLPTRGTTNGRLVDISGGLRLGSPVFVSRWETEDSGTAGGRESRPSRRPSARWRA